MLKAHSCGANLHNLNRCVDVGRFDGALIDGCVGRLQPSDCGIAFSHYSHSSFHHPSQASLIVAAQGAPGISSVDDPPISVAGH
jgi:hypothetical protein